MNTMGKENMYDENPYFEPKSSGGLITKKVPNAPVGFGNWLIKKKTSDRQ